MKSIRSLAFLLSGILFFVFLDSPAWRLGVRFGNIVDFSSLLSVGSNEPGQDIRMKLPRFFPSIRVMTTGKSRGLSSFQDAIVDALREMDEKNRELLDQVMEAAESISEGSEMTNVTINEETGEVQVEWSSGGLVLSQAGKRIIFSRRPGSK